MTTPLDTLVVEITADGTSFRKGLDAASAHAKAWANSLKPTMGGVGEAMAFVAKSVAAVGAAAAAAAVGGVALLVKNSLAATDAMAKLSDKTGIQIEALYGWQVAADDVGVELESVTKMSQILQRHISEAASGNEAAAATFRRLGLDMAALRGASPEAALGMVSDKLNAIENQADKTAIGMQAFGRGFMENGNFIRLGSEGLEKAKKRAEELGLTLNRVDAAKLELVNDAFDELKSVIAGVGNTFAVALAPFILKATQGLVDASIASGNFKKEIRAAVEGAVGMLGTLLDVLRRLQMGWLIIKATFLEFSGVLNSGLEKAVRFIQWVGVATENFGSALMSTARMGQSGLEVMWTAVKMAAAKSLGFMIDGLADVLFAIADVTFYTSEELGKSFESAALKTRRAAHDMSSTYDAEFKKIKQDSAAAAEETAAAWIKLANSDGTSTWSVKLAENAAVAKEKAAEAWVKLTTLMNQPMPSEGIEAWKQSAMAAIQTVANEVAAGLGPKAQGSGEGPGGQEGGSAEFQTQMFNIGTLESDHAAYREVLAEKFVDIQTQRREFQANMDLEIETMKEAHLATLEQQEAASQARTAALWESGMKGKLQIAGSILGQLSALQGSHSRKQFEVWKAAAIGETIVNTYSAAMGAYNAMAAIPYIGPALGVAAAAAAVAAGLANVQKINSTSFGGGGGGGAPTAAQMGNGVGANANTGGDAGGVYGGGQGGPAKQVVIQLQGDSMYSASSVRSLIDAINGQMGDGAVVGSLRAS